MYDFLCLTSDFDEFKIQKIKLSILARLVTKANEKLALITFKLTSSKT